MSKLNWVAIANEDLEKEMEDERLSALDQQKYDDMCICGEKLDDCTTAYEHMSGGV